MNPFSWTEASEKALALWVQGNLTFIDIAACVGIDRRTFYNWREHPEFKARYDDEITEFRNEVRRIGIATVEKRVHALNDRYMRIKRIIDSRADDPDMKDVPGGTTGLYIKQSRGVGKGDDFRVVYDFVVDTGLLKEIRELERQAAQELGQWNAKSDENEVSIRDAVKRTSDAGTTYRDPDDDDPAEAEADTPDDA